MKVAIFGANGNMGRRYQAILTYIAEVKGKNIEVIPIEPPYSRLTINGALRSAEKVIIASPSDKHIQNLLEIKKDRGPSSPQLDVLCEKPVVVTEADIELLFMLSPLAAIKLYVVNQYCYLPQSGRFLAGTGDTLYDYYKHGDDGILWDCFQLIGIAKGRITLKEESPVWTCVINGVNVSDANMDRAYIRMIDDFLFYKQRLWGMDEIDRITRKITQFIKDGDYRYSSTE